MSKTSPLRKCVGCNEMKPKEQMIRIACVNGKVCMDPTGKAGGRGVYLCKSPSCARETAKKRGLNRGLKCQVPEEVYAKLLEEFS